jgi:ATP-dependent DNA ligase
MKAAAIARSKLLNGDAVLHAARICCGFPFHRPGRVSSPSASFSLAKPLSSPARPPGHEIKFDGYRLIARKDGDQVRL